MAPLRRGAGAGRPGPRSRGAREEAGPVEPEVGRSGSRGGRQGGRVRVTGGGEAGEPARAAGMPGPRWLGGRETAAPPALRRPWPGEGGGGGKEAARAAGRARRGRAGRGGGGEDRPEHNGGRRSASVAGRGRGRGRGVRGGVFVELGPGCSFSGRGRDRCSPPANRAE